MLQLVRVHEPDAVREIVNEAWKIATEQVPEGDEWRLIFSKAVDLLAQRIPVQPVQAEPFFTPHPLGVR